MTKLLWHQTGTKTYETGVSRGVLFVLQNDGAYGEGVAWSGLTTVTESPSGGEATKQYADNVVYATLVSAEDFGATIEAFTYPDEWEECDGSKEVVPGVVIGQQGRRSFAFSYQTLLGNDIQGTDYGYIIHIVYGGTAAPSEKTNNTVNDSPELSALSWEISTTPIDAGEDNKPTAHLKINSTRVDPAALQALEDILYGTAGTESRVPLPEEVYEIIGDPSVTVATPTKPTNVGNVITIPTITGVDYYIGNTKLDPGAQPAITQNVLVTARTKPGYKFPENFDADWGYVYTP